MSGKYKTKDFNQYLKKRLTTPELKEIRDSAAEYLDFIQEALEESIHRDNQVLIKECKEKIVNYSK